MDGSPEITFEGKQAWDKPVSINATMEYSDYPITYFDGTSIYLENTYRNMNFVKKGTQRDLQF